MLGRGCFDAIEQYLEDAVEFWSSVQSDQLHEMFENFEQITYKKYDRGLIDFMQRQGFPIYQLFSQCKNESLKRNLISALDRQLLDFRKTGEPIKGVLTFSQNIMNDEDFLEQCQTLNDESDY